MDDEKRLCPNCGKELTKSARKCKYCDESLIPKSESSIKNFKEFLFVAFCITLVLLVFWGIISLIFNLGHWLFSHFQQRIPQEIVQLPNINDCFLGDFLPWLVNTGIGSGIGIIVLGGIIITVFILSIKECASGTKEILDELASIDFTPTPKNSNTKKESVNVGSVIIKGSKATIYDVSGTKLETISVIEPTTLMSCGGKCFTLRCKNRIETYEYRGGLFGFVRISSRNV